MFVIFKSASMQPIYIIEMCIRDRLLGVSLPSLAFAQNAKGNSETIIITAPRPSLPSQNEVKGSNTNNDGAYDAASVLDNSAGVAVIKNGTQTGIIQLRGLSQDRVKVVVDGVEINPACPNHMDPPLHYVCLLYTSRCV